MDRRAGRAGLGVTIWILYIAAGLFVVAMILPIAIQTLKWSLEERRRRRQKQRIGGDISEAIRRDMRFWDDEPDPWAWVD